jgi:exodeoxyribonuclease-5
VKWSHTPEQDRALVAVNRWLHDPHAPQVFYLAGYAGTGKTSLAKDFAEDIDGDVFFVAPTGKAAKVLREKKCWNAQTIHSLIYVPVGGDPPSPEAIQQLRNELVRLREVKDPGAQATADKIAEQIKRAEENIKKGSGPRFSLNIESKLRQAKLCVCDEVSMVNELMGRDLESFGTKLLVLGDPAQLPPVYGAGYFTARDPDFLLTEIHRQEADSPIHFLAGLARRGERLPYGKHGDCEVLHRGDPSLEARAMAADIMIVGRNKTRHACNTKARRLLGRGNEPAPIPGDKVICLRNDYETGLFNGSTWDVTRCVPDLDKMTATIDLEDEWFDEDNKRHVDGVECEAWLHHFMGREDELAAHDRRKRAEVGFANAITCHKSQGSAWKNVVVFDESSAFGKDANRWKYTAITRASRRVEVVA